MASLRLKAALFAALLAFAGGCATSSGTKYINLDASDPSIVITSRGVKLNDKYVDPKKIPAVLEEFEVPKDRVICMRIDDINDFDGGVARGMKQLLARHGWSRSAIVTKEHAESWSRNPYTLEEMKRGFRRIE